MNDLVSLGEETFLDGLGGGTLGGPDVFSHPGPFGWDAVSLPRFLVDDHVIGGSCFVCHTNSIPHMGTFVKSSFYI